MHVVLPLSGLLNQLAVEHLRDAELIFVLALELDAHLERLRRVRRAPRLEPGLGEGLVLRPSDGRLEPPLLRRAVAVVLAHVPEEERDRGRVLRVREACAGHG